MRRRISVALAVFTAVLTALVVLPAASSGAESGPAPVDLVQIPPGVGPGFMSPNMTYVGTIPIESPGVSARLVKVGAVKRLYVSSAKGLAVYDVTNPELPLLLGRLDTHNWENEDVAVAPDGKTVLMSDFEGVAYLIVIAVDDLPGGLVSLTVKGVSAPGGNHTVECVDNVCNWAYGSSGKIYDLRDKSNPVVAGSWSAITGRGGHHVTRDANGLMWTDTTPIFALNPRPDPLHPTIVASSDPAQMGANTTAYQHNNLRPFAKEYKPRIKPEDLSAPSLRPGEILLGEGETNFSDTCNSGSGPFVTYDLRNYDQPGATAFKPLDVFRPINGDWQDGNPAINELGCSGHWFDISPASTHAKIITSNGWYEHGTRVFAINGKTGKISQLAFFQPVVGSASASYWVNKDYLYTVDYERGIDILKFDRTAPVPSRSDFDASWLAKLNVKDALAEAERYYCRLGATGNGSSTG